jgi:hypothetical protein
MEEYDAAQERNTRGAMLRGPVGIAIQLPNGKRQVDDGSSELVHSTSRHKHWSRLG